MRLITPAASVWRASCRYLYLGLVPQGTAQTRAAGSKSTAVLLSSLFLFFSLPQPSSQLSLPLRPRLHSQGFCALHRPPACSRPAVIPDKHPHQQGSLTTHYPTRRGHLASIVQLPDRTWGILISAYLRTAASIAERARSASHNHVVWPSC